MCVSLRRGGTAARPPAGAWTNGTAPRCGAMTVCAKTLYLPGETLRRTNLPSCPARADGNELTSNDDSSE